MAITFRGQASKLNKAVSKNNRHSFHEVSAPGPRRGAGGTENSPTKKNCSPITQRSRSPLKINEALVAGAGNTGKKFVDAGKEVAKAFTTLEAEPAAADLNPSHLGKEKTKKKKEKTKKPKVDPIVVPKSVGVQSVSTEDAPELIL